MPYKVPAQIGIKGNEEAKPAIDMSEMTTTRLPYTDYFLHYIKPCIAEYESAYNSCRQYEIRLHNGHSE